MSLSQHNEDAFEPVVEQFETPAEVIIVAHFSGVNRDEVKLNCTSNSVSLIITGPTDSSQLARMGYYAHEVVKLYGWNKTIALKTEIIPSTAKATFKHGTLEVRITKQLLK